jgi:hypothetical protein
MSRNPKQPNPERQRPAPTSRRAERARILAERAWPSEPCRVADEGSDWPSSSFGTEEAALKEDKLRAEYTRRTIPSGPVGWHNIGDAIWRAPQKPPHLRNPPINHKAAKHLIQKLKDGLASGFPAPTLASSMAMRTTRQAVMGTLLQALDDYADDDLRTFTVVNTKWALTPVELDAVDAATIRNQLRTHLNRVGVLAMPGPLVAFTASSSRPMASTNFTSTA